MDPAHPYAVPTKIQDLFNPKGNSIVNLATKGLSGRALQRYLDNNLPMPTSRNMMLPFASDTKNVAIYTDAVAAARGRPLLDNGKLDILLVDLLKAQLSYHPNDKTTEKIKQKLDQELATVGLCPSWVSSPPVD
jgi:hypothetical protein